MKKNIKWYIVICLILSIIQLGCSRNDEKYDDSESNILNYINTYVSNFTKIPYTEEKSVEKKQSFAAELEDGRVWSPMTVTDDGKMYGYTETYDNNKVDIISYDINSKKFEVLSTRDDSLLPVFIKHTDNYIFWLEDNSDFDNPYTRFILYDIQNKELTVIDENKYMYLTNGNIAMNNEMLLWVDYKLENNINIPIIEKYDLNTKEYSVYKENALNPVICDDFIAYLGPDTVDENKIGLYLNNLNSGEVNQYAHNYDIYEINGYKNSLVMSYKDSSDQKIGILENGTVEDIVTNKNSEVRFEYLDISNNFIYWASLHQFIVYDRTTGKTLLIDADYESAKGGVSNKYIYQLETIYNKESNSKVSGSSNINNLQINIYEINQ